VLPDSVTFNPPEHPLEVVVAGCAFASLLLAPADTITSATLISRIVPSENATHTVPSCTPAVSPAAFTLSDTVAPLPAAMLPDAGVSVSQLCVLVELNVKLPAPAFVNI
jgi:hypothetical protein